MSWRVTAWRGPPWMIWLGQKGDVERPGMPTLWNRECCGIDIGLVLGRIVCLRVTAYDPADPTRPSITVRPEHWRPRPPRALRLVPRFEGDAPCTDSSASASPMPPRPSLRSS